MSTAPTDQPNPPKPAESPTKKPEQSPEQSRSKSRSPRERGGGGRFQRSFRNNNNNSRSRSRNRKFLNIMERWHYQKCSEIKIHFYVKNLYIGNQGEDGYLHFVRERVQKAGPCDLIQISGRNRDDQTLDIAIGMRYDQDAKLIYIGKKHINLASKYNINKNKNIIPVISNMFEILLEKNDELDKAKLEQNLRKSRFGDHSGKKRSSSQSGSRSSSKKSSASSRSPQSRSRSRSKQKSTQNNASQPQIKPQLTAPQKQQLQQLQQQQQELKPTQLTKPQLVQYKPVMLSLSEQEPPQKETIQIFCIPQEFTIQECLKSVQDQLQLTLPPEGQFKIEKSKAGDQTFEYLELTLEQSQYQRLMSNLPVRIKDVPCLACQRTNNLSFRELLKQFQLFVSPTQKINSRTIYSKFKDFGEIVAFYNIDSQIRDAEDYILIYAQESSIKKLAPPSQVEVQKDPNQKVTCSYRYLESVDIQFVRPPFNQTIYAQSQQMLQQQKQRQELKQQQQQQQQQPPAPKPKPESESSSSSSSSKRSVDSKSSRSASSGSRPNRQHYRRQYDNRRRQSNYTQYRNNNYRGRGNYQDNEDRRRGGGRYNQRQDRGRRYDN